MNRSYDPYDIWSTRLLGCLKVSYTNGSFLSKISLVFIGLLELIVPVTFRRLLRVEKSFFPHIEAMIEPSNDGDRSASLRLFESLAIGGNSCAGWGLPFKWFSKNGVYSADTAYITNTPYVMEALLGWRWSRTDSPKARDLFFSTWGFLGSLKILHETDSKLALSYAPIDEPRPVINANSYAALAYAMHATSGRLDNRKEANKRATQLVNWVVHQQDKNGSWTYYADTESGNFIDCFHSCFIIKNLIKVQSLVPELTDNINSAIPSGWNFIRSYFYDERTGLCRRFIHKDLKDPFRWDLYDQAEYLGLLVDFELYDEAERFTANVEAHFLAGDHWYCKIDILGRKWGKGFLRWGIVPFLHHKSRLDNKLESRSSSCAA